MSTPVGKKREWFGSGEFNDAEEVVLKLAHSADAVVYVTKVTFSITTHADGKKLFVGASTDADTDLEIVVAAHTDKTAAAGVPSVVTYDFGKWGIPLPAGIDLVGESEASGPDGWFYAEGWEDIGDGTQ